MGKSGVAITSNQVSVGGDVVGGSKYEHHGEIVFPLETPEEKHWLIFGIERLATFIFALLIGGLILALFGGGIGAVVGGEGGAGAGALIGVVLAFALAIAAAGNVSKRRSPI